MKSKSGALASQGQVCNLCRVTDLSAESEENTIVCCIRPLVGVGGGFRGIVLREKSQAHESSS